MGEQSAVDDRLSTSSAVGTSSPSTSKQRYMLILQVFDLATERTDVVYSRRET